MMTIAERVEQLLASSPPLTDDQRRQAVRILAGFRTERGGSR